MALTESAPEAPGAASVRFAELCLRQGRREEARQLLLNAGPLTAAVIGLGELALGDGDPHAACDAADRVLRRIPAGDVLERMPALELRARAHAALGAHAAAEADAARVRAAADRLGSAYRRGRAHRVVAEVAEAALDAERARRAAEDAIDCFEAGGAPYDAACARMLLADALAALGRPERAQAEAAAAFGALAELGAVP